METEKSKAYIRAKKKVDTLKGFYGHILSYVIVNLFLIIAQSGLLSSAGADFSRIGIYFTAMIWGIGLFFHALYVLFYFKFKNNYMSRWEDKKIQEILDKDR